MNTPKKLSSLILLLLGTFGHYAIAQSDLKPVHFSSRLYSVPFAFVGTLIHSELSAEATKACGNGVRAVMRNIKITIEAGRDLTNMESQGAILFYPEINASAEVQCFQQKP